MTSCKVYSFKQDLFISPNVGFINQLGFIWSGLLSPFQFSYQENRNIQIKLCSCSVDKFSSPPQLTGFFWIPSMVLQFCFLGMWAVLNFTPTQLLCHLCPFLSVVLVALTEVPHGYIMKIEVGWVSFLSSHTQLIWHHTCCMILHIIHYLT